MSRKAWTASEDEVLIDWALRRGKGILGNKIWMDLEKSKILKDRTWQSMRQRVKVFLQTTILKRIEEKPGHARSHGRLPSVEQRRVNDPAISDPFEFEVERSITPVDDDPDVYVEDGIVYAPVGPATQLPTLEVVKGIAQSDTGQRIEMGDVGVGKTDVFQPNPIVLERIQMGIERLKRLCPFTGATDRVVIHALIVTGGDFDMARKYLSGIQLPTDPWTYEEDSILMSDDKVAIKELIEKRSEEAAIARIQFLDDESISLLG